MWGSEDGIRNTPSEEVSVIPLKIKTFIVRLALVIHRQLWSIIKESHSCPKLLKRVKKNKESSNHFQCNVNCKSVAYHIIAVCNSIPGVVIMLYLELSDFDDAKSYIRTVLILTYNDTGNR